MAGLGFKDFQVGEVLTSSDVDGYLMQQTVMRFADSGARGSALGTAIGTAVALAEGMVSYLDDANTIQVYDGSDWASPIPGIGNNVQVGQITSNFTTTSATRVDTGVDATITLTNANSKVLVLFSAASLQTSNTGQISILYLYRDATDISARTYSQHALNTGVNLISIDTPGSVGPHTYKIKAAITAGSTLSLTAAAANPARIIVIEVAA